MAHAINKSAKMKRFCQNAFTSTKEESLTTRGIPPKSRRSTISSPPAFGTLNAGPEQKRACARDGNCVFECVCVCVCVGGGGTA